MKNLAILLIGLITLSSTTFATNTSTSESTARYNAVFDGSKYIFVENGIEFSLFADGEFDFYIPEYVQGINANVNAGPVGISFNTGFDYDPYVQYDEYGAVIQIENTPLYYDNYGRLSQAGDVRINYRNNRIARVGGLYVHYNNYGVYSHYTGFINVYNRNYVFNPYHNFFYRPVFNRCLVWTTPYRRYYTPIRYNFAFHHNNYNRGFRNGYANARRDFRRPNTGRVAHNNGRRDNVDRNNVSFRKARTTSSHNRNTTRGIASNSANRNDRVNNGNSRGIATTTSGNTNTRGNSRGIAPNSTNRTDRVNNGNSRGIASTTSRNTNARGNSRGIATTTSRNTNARGNSRGVATKSKPNTSRSSRTTSQRSTPNRKATSSRAKSNTNRSTSNRSTQRSSSSRTKVAFRSNTSRSSKKTSKSSNSRRR